MSDRKQVLFELYKYLKNGSCSDWERLLFDLIAKADLKNRQKLQREFPEYVGTYLEFKEKGESIFKCFSLRERLRVVQ